MLHGHALRRACATACGGTGVTCSALGNVTELNLAGYDLGGNLPPAVPLLVELQASITNPDALHA